MLHLERITLDPQVMGENRAFAVCALLLVLWLG